MCCVVMSHKEGFAMISKLVIGLMKEGFENFDKVLLYRAILFGRQIMLKDEVPISVSYGLWFQTFIGDCITLNNPKIFSFFISVMTDLIPLEKDIDAALIQKMSVPFECQSVYSEYMTLLKTRVRDLEPHVQPEKTIERVLSLFQETGKIPPFVLEASLVQKHQFLNEFLPALLTPRLKPQIPDTKENFITALFQAGKIPNSLLQKYELACKKEEDLLLADINMAGNFIEIFRG
ncbi:Fanconi anemia group A protein-like isoform X2 [Stegodyphus dumicola]|uniref:Fanconi anemia group A protein-like isoform X2 n=1 Tax=Stegodyphus dumicola TaxID=202533 RepID=UPI0015AC4A3C|nr:Fanconi anemia group A protein-like isoform X2 [Stegodyphus dumicola]